MSFLGSFTPSLKTENHDETLTFNVENTQTFSFIKRQHDTNDIDVNVNDLLDEILSSSSNEVGKPQPARSLSCMKQERIEPDLQSKASFARVR